MFCPKCKAEYRPGFAECADCRVDLVDELPKEQQAEAVELVTVFRSGDGTLIPAVKSLLQSAGIDFMVRGEKVQDLFGAGRFAHVNIVVGPVEFVVRAEDADEARRLIEEVPFGQDVGGMTDDDQDDT